MNDIVLKSKGIKIIYFGIYSFEIIYNFGIYILFFLTISDRVRRK